MRLSIREIAVVLLLIGAALMVYFSSAEGGETDILTRGVFALMQPFQKAVVGLRTGVKGFWDNYVNIMDVRKDNVRLKKEVDALRMEKSLLVRKERENQRLRKLLRLKEQYDFPSVAAQVIGEDATGWYRTFFIDRGSEDGVLVNMPIAVADGVVGRVSATSRSVSRALLITDPNIAVDCRIARTRDRGVLSGQLGGACVLRYISLDSTVRQGDEVVTSGMDGIFPRGLRVGTVKSVRLSSQGLFKEATVVPAVDFNRVEEVLIVTGERGGFQIPTELREKP